jgi:hypothetical protein
VLVAEYAKSWIAPSTRIFSDRSRTGGVSLRAETGMMSRYVYDVPSPKIGTAWIDSAPALPLRLIRMESRYGVPSTSSSRALSLP